MTQNAIKPEDISDDLVDIAYDYVLSELDGGIRNDVAAIVNAAVEAGLVVRAVPDDDSKVLRRVIENLYSQVREDDPDADSLEQYFTVAKAELQNEKA